MAYTYDVASSFAGGKVNVNVFLSEIAASSIVTALDTGATSYGGGSTDAYGVTTGGNLSLSFKADLSSQDDATLAALVAAHAALPTSETQPVTVTNAPNTIIKQEAKTYGHYRIVPLEIAGIAPGTIQYKDWTTPNFTSGVDWLSAEFFAGDADSGDMICTGKALFGQIGIVAAPASTGATTVMLAGPIGLLREMDKFEGGVLDEGFFLSFGVENSTDTAINAASPPGTGTPENPQPELTEYEIMRIGLPSPVGDGVNEVVAITFFTPLLAGISPGTNVNLVVRSIHEAFSLAKNDRISIGGQQIAAGNLPAGRIVRFGYKNNGAATKTARARFVIFY